MSHIKSHSNAQDNKHIFALYYPESSPTLGMRGVGQEVIINDKDLFHRIVHVLRLQQDDLFIIFDEHINALAEVVSLSGKNQIRFTIKNKQNNKQFLPHITFALPLLKRDDLESAIDALAQIGINTIQLIHSAKMSVKWGGSKELDRLHRIAIASCEQSKNFVPPKINDPISFTHFESLLFNESYKKFYFDPQGSSLQSVVSQIDAAQNNMHRIVLTVGPEGGFTDHEKQRMQQAQFIFCALTPTILRATQAASLSAGIMRSLLY